MDSKPRMTYLSLFSSAGVGCHGFDIEGFECVATNEIIARRLDIQRLNKKCKYDSGYILGDITQPEIKSQLFAELGKWRDLEKINDLDVIIATPPCQGMSVANHKKRADDVSRNSLVVESVDLVNRIEPKFFVFENVSSFLKTVCVTEDGEAVEIEEMIDTKLGKKYSIHSEVLNFKNYGANSSRTRTLVIGVRKDLANHILPITLFPDFQRELTLRDVIGSLRSLQDFGMIDPEDIFHSFRPYPPHMRSWVQDLNQGESAFDNLDPKNIPHRVVNGKTVMNQRKNGDKYTRQFWDRVAPCIHTRNDQLASQNTVHPVDDRVFSIRELMRMMSIPDNFKWVEEPVEKLNCLDEENKRNFLKHQEMKIRQCIGEAVPTEVFRRIAVKIAGEIVRKRLTHREIQSVIKTHELESRAKLNAFISANPLDLAVPDLSMVAEMANPNRGKHAAFYTNLEIVGEIVRRLPQLKSSCLRILEPSVGAGNFLHAVIKKYEYAEAVEIDVVDVDESALETLELILRHSSFPENVKIRFIHADFLNIDLKPGYDLIVGNPPFGRVTGGAAEASSPSRQRDREYSNLASLFMLKSLELGKNVALVMPKSILSTSDFEIARKNLESSAVDVILDFGELGFRGVLIETVAVIVRPNSKPRNTLVVSVTDNEQTLQSQGYITDASFPGWLIYRDANFDSVAQKMELNIFNAVRDRQVTNKLLNDAGGIRVLRSRNISDDGKSVIDIPDYDKYLSHEHMAGLLISRYLDRDDVFLVPNMTYKPRILRKPQGVLVNGSVAILSLNDPKKTFSDKDAEYISSVEFRDFYRTARNRQTRSLNIDKNSVFFFGRLKTQ